MERGPAKDDRLDVPCSKEFKEDIAALARMHGFHSTAEYVRDILERLAYGEMAMFRRYRDAGKRSMGGSSHDQ